MTTSEEQLGREIVKNRTLKHRNNVLKKQNRDLRARNKGLASRIGQNGELLRSVIEERDRANEGWRQSSAAWAKIQDHPKVQRIEQDAERGESLSLVDVILKALDGE